MNTIQKEDIYEIVPLSLLRDIYISLPVNTNKQALLDHSLKVMFNAILLCQEKNVKIKIPVIFAIIHDTYLSKDTFENHGELAAQSIVFLKDELRLSKKESDLLFDLCKYHNTDYEATHLIEKICFYADQISYQSSPKDISELTLNSELTSFFLLKKSELNKFTQDIKNDIISSLKRKTYLFNNVL